MNPTPARGPDCSNNWLAKIWNAIHGKQNKLTAGQGIAIDEHDVISATGGGGAGAWGSITGDIDDQLDLKQKFDDLEDELGDATLPGTIRGDIAQNASDIEDLEDEIGAEGTAGTVRDDIGKAYNYGTVSGGDGGSYHLYTLGLQRKNGNWTNLQNGHKMYHALGTGDEIEKTQGVSRYGLKTIYDALVSSIATRADQSDLTAEINNRTYQDAQIRQELQQGLATREPLLSDAQHNAVNSGITAAKVGQYDANIFSPRCISVQGQVSTTGDIYGVVSYTRIAPGYGFLSLSIRIPTTTLANHQSITATNIASLLGFNFERVANCRGSFNWYPDPGAGLQWTDRLDYGTYSLIESDNTIRVGRKYGTTPQTLWGDWEYKNIPGLVQISNILIHET